MEKQQQPLLSASTVNNAEGGDREDLDLDIDDEEEQNRNKDNAGVIPKWWEQITVRGLVVSAFVGAIFCVIAHKLNLTVGIMPSLNVAAGLLGFFSVKGWTRVMSRLGFSTSPFTRQENTVIQTCIVACYGITFSGNRHHRSHPIPSLYISAKSHI